uniref:Multiple epidermal growth factor-like domains 11 n=1 Tax=Magallana gigas TaxID=29159 RepID=K1QZ68_MAGGI
MSGLVTKIYAVFVCAGVFAFANGYVNVALNKPAFLQYPVSHDLYDASNAVDGRKSDLSNWGGQCAVSWPKQTATWWVNLTTIHSIHHITIYFRTDNKPWGPSNRFTKYVLGFSVYISNTTDRLQGTLCYKDDNFTVYTIPAVFTTTCPVHGQYVIYYNERLPGVTYPFVSVDLCEVEVYGCPATGCYGSNNTLPCPDVNCQYCHIETGTCQGCKPGYQGYRCELACDEGIFGTECKETCGHCRDVSHCSNINGTCLTGCGAGYQGDLCKTPCDKGKYGSECNETCGHCRDVKQCSNINGTCLTGCDPDYQGDLCETPCPVGYFGQDCSETCINSYTCDGCNDVSGSCYYGCRPGWIGYFCQKKGTKACLFYYITCQWFVYKYVLTSFLSVV